MRRLGDPLGHRIGNRGFLPGVFSSWPVRYPRLRSFHVDATGGADGDDGRTPDTAWQTIGKVNGETFLPGDYILFKRGETWVGTMLAIPSSGSVQRPIVIDAYDAGANPIIDGNDLVHCVVGNGQDNLVFRNIEVTQGLDFGFSFDNETNIVLVDCDAHDCGNDNLIFDDCSFCSVTGGEFYNAYVRVQDGRTVSGIEIKDECHDILIDGATCYSNVGVAAPPHFAAGIAIHNHAGQTMSHNLVIKDCILRDGGVNSLGLRVNNDNGAVMTDRNIIVENNTVTANADGGIQLNATAGVAFPLNGVIVRDNIILLNTNSFQLEVRHSSNVSVYRNLLRNNNDDGAAQNISIQDSININVFNNTTYSDFNNFWFSVNITGASCANVVLLNNIIGGAIANMTNITVPVATGIVGLVIDYNLYQYVGGGNRWHWLGAGINYGAWQGFNSNDANSPARADPLFVDPASDDFTLQAGSPAINAGTPVGLPFLGAAPDCGAFERE